MHWLSSALPDKLPPKAATLARLIQAGLPVPEGFVLTPEEASTLVSTPPPPEATVLRAEIETAYHNLCEKSNREVVAVRAAGLQEDSRQASFAGQYETHLNVPGGNALFTAIAACARSGENQRLQAYQQALAPTILHPPGVIVQAMIEPQTAGILFTVHPITGDNRFLLVEATPGLAETLASGLETPARLTFSRDGTAHTMLAVERLPLPFRATDFWQPLLHMALRIKDLLGGPQDIEWAYADGQFWILQARPITVQPATEPPPDTALWTRANIGEVLSGVVTPLTWSTFIHVIRQAEDPRRSPRPSEMARLFNGRAYMQRQALWDSYANIWDIRPEVVLGRGIGCDVSQDAETLRARQPQAPFTERLLKSVYVWRELLTLRFVRPKLEKNLSALGPQLVFLTEESLRHAVGGRLRKHLRATLAVTREAFQAHMQASFLAFCAYAATWQHLEKTAGAEAADQWMATCNISFKDKALWDAHLTALVRKVYDTPPLATLFRSHTGHALYEALSDNLEGRAFLDEIRHRARQMGDRAAQEFELRRPRWSEDVQPLVGAVQARLLSAGHPTQPVPLQLRHKLVLQPTRRMTVLGRRRFFRLRAAFTAYTHMRERTKSLLMACFGELRRVALASGDWLYERGYLNRPDDVFFLELLELDNLLVGQYAPDLPEKVVQRQRRHAYHEKHRPVGPTLVAEGNTLYGTAVSSGRVTGRVRVVHDPSQTALLPGEILVTEATDPGWMPVFITAGAIVTEIGGLLSHTATLARELGKPAVFAVPGATQRLRDGQQVTVDGWSGSVEIAEPPSA